MSEAKLKACPFCGLQPNYQKTVWTDGTPMEGITCTNPECGIRPDTDWWRPIPEATEMWNKRAGDRQPTAPQTPEPSTLVSATGSATALPDWHRLTLLHDGKEIMGCTITSKRPENHEQMTELIRELLRMMEAPTVPDPEVLGDRSPNDELNDRRNQPES